MNEISLIISKSTRTYQNKCYDNEQTRVTTFISSEAIKYLKMCLEYKQENKITYREYANKSNELSISRSIFYTVFTLPALLFTIKHPLEQLEHKL